VPEILRFVGFLEFMAVLQTVLLPKRSTKAQQEKKKSTGIFGFLFAALPH